jgi:amino acid permease
MVIYILAGFLGVFLFGAKMEGNVLKNFDSIPTLPSYILRCCFAVVIILHTPFVFFVGKESLLSIIGQIILVENNKLKPRGNRATEDEVKNHSIKVRNN